MNSHSKIEKLQIDADANVETVERILDTFYNAENSALPPAAADIHTVFRLATISGSAILGDVWAAIFAGTLCRFRKPVTVRAWGLPNVIPPQSEFLRTLPAIAAFQEATAIVADSVGGQPVDVTFLRSILALENAGVAERTPTDSRTLVEFDPEHPVAPLLTTPNDPSGASASNIRNQLKHFVLVARRQLEIGAIRRGTIPTSAGPAGAVGQFIAELHENGRTHGSRGIDDRGVRGVRFVRIRKHVANTKEALLKRCRSYEKLAEHVGRVMPETSSPGLIEASISDFGPGILDGFLSSTASTDYKSQSRRDLLDRLLHEQVSSKANDPGAGLGIPRALSAARKMGAFVSLRTGEHWLSASFSDAVHEERLRDVSSRVCSYVAGTHWQLIWLQP